MKRLLLIASVLFSISFSACLNKVIRGSGHFVDETRTPIGSFTKIKLNANYEVTVVKDSIFLVELHGEDNILPEVATDVFNGELVLSFKKSNARFDFEKVRIKVHLPSLTDATIQGSGNITSLDTFTVDNATATISGSGNLIYSVITKKLVSKTQGSGDLTVKGSADDEEIYISGSGDSQLQDLLAQRCFVNISASGNTKVDASEWLDVTISGSGSVMYRKKTGSPLRNVKITGSGNVTEF